MCFPILINWTSPIPILELLVVFFIFIQFSKETSVRNSKGPDLTMQNAFCGVWSGFALFVDVPQKDARLIWVKVKQPAHPSYARER